MCKHDWPKSDRSSVKQHQQDANNESFGDIPNACPPVISSEQYGRDDDQGIPVTQVRPEQMMRAAAEYNFLAIRNQGQAEGIVDNFMPPVQFGVGPEHRCGQRGINGPPNPTTQIVVNEDDADNPGDGFPTSYPQVLPPEGNNPCGRNTG
jgi:hypothetical protein